VGRRGGALSQGQSSGKVVAGWLPAGRGGVPFDTSRAHMARVYDFWLGGKDNYAADRAVAEQVAQRAAPASRVVYVDNDPIGLGTPGPC